MICFSFGQKQILRFAQNDAVHAGEGIRTHDDHLGKQERRRFPQRLGVTGSRNHNHRRYPDDPRVTPEWCSRWCSAKRSTT